MEKWQKLSILEVANLYRRKELSPVELVESIFRRVVELEPRLNSFITIIEREAISSAKRAEKIFLAGESPHILYGIPFSVKDLYETKGIKTTAGSKILKDYLPRKTAQLVKSLQDHGAILLGKTNMLEFAYGIVHPDYGQTNNPWDLSKTAGGSSGGSAASVALGLGLFSLGSDTGGSIRIPASYCGIAGLKPTYGLLSLDGVFPLSPSLDHAGPIAKTSEDLLIVMSALVPGFESDIKEPKEKIVIGILPPADIEDVQEDVAAVYQDVLKQMKNLGWETKEIELKYFRRTEEIVMNVLLPEAALIHEQWISRKEDYAPLTFKQIEAGLTHRSLDYLKAKQELILAKEELNLVFKDVDLIMTPTVPYPAPEEDPVLEEDNEMKYTGLFNVSGHPAITLNAGFSSAMLPIGIQLIGKHGDDKWLLESAVILEKQLNKLLKGYRINV